MSTRKVLLGAAAAVMMIASGACTPGKVDLSPSLTREIVIPEIGQTAAAVAAANGEPDIRRRADGDELWGYSRTIPEGAGLRSGTAVVRIRQGVVVAVDTTVGKLVTPTPTFPLPGRSAEAAGS
jgi:hypothetical protein